MSRYDTVPIGHFRVDGGCVDAVRFSYIELPFSSESHHAVE
jgi:hypothetical protein